jgi:hypothetical protein
MTWLYWTAAAVAYLLCGFVAIYLYCRYRPDDFCMLEDAGPAMVGFFAVAPILLFVVYPIVFVVVLSEKHRERDGSKR